MVRARDGGDCDDYAEAYRRWIGSMTPDELAEARRLGVDRPAPENYRAGGLADAGEWAADESPSRPSSPESTDFADRLGDILMYVLDRGSPRLTLQCILRGVGHPFYRRTVEDIAREHGISKQAVSQRQRIIFRELGLRESAMVRSEAKARVYSRTNRRNRN